LPANLDEVGYENPGYYPPFFDNVEDVIKELALKLA